MLDTDKLTADLTDAIAAARAAIAGMRDGGTCCMDFPTIRLGCRMTPKIEAAIRAAGLDPRPVSGRLWTGYTGLHRFPGEQFQGGPRTAGAEAVEKLLRSRGYSTSVYYQMD